MGNPTLAELADKVPALVRAGIKGLADDDRLGLVIALAEGGKMTFSEIKAKYGLNPSTLSSHLNALQSGNLVRNYYEKGIGRAYSYYEATELPEAVVSALFRSVHKAEGGKERPPHPENVFGARNALHWQAEGGKERPPHPEVYYLWAPLDRAEGGPNPQPQSGAETQSRTPASAATQLSSIIIPDNDMGAEARYGGRIYKPRIKAADGGRSASV